MKSIDSIETYAYGMNKNLVCKKEEIKCDNIIKQYKNVYLGLYYKRRHKRIYFKLAGSPEHPYRILIVRGSGSAETNALLILLNNEPDINKIYLYARDPYEAKYQLLINKRENTGLKIEGLKTSIDA